MAATLGPASTDLVCAALRQPQLLSALTLPGWDVLVCQARRAGLLGRSLMRLQGVDPGFQPGSALSLRVTLPQRSYADSNAQHTFHQRTIEGLKALPGTRAGHACRAQ